MKFLIVTEASRAGAQRRRTDLNLEHGADAGEKTEELK